MQPDRTAKRMHRPVLGVAVNWVGMVGELDAELMRPPRLRPHFQPAQPAMSCTPLVVQQSLPRAGIVRLNDFDAPSFPVFQQPVFQRSGRVIDFALDNCPVSFLNRTFAELFREPRRGLAGTSE